jgi:ABC-type multidrug transport system ATPase subunit
MNASVFKSLIRLIALYLSTLKSTEKRTVISSLIARLRSLTSDFDKTTLIDLSEEYSKDISEGNKTIDQLIFEVTDEIKTSAGEKDKLIFLLILLYVIKYFEDIGKVILPERIAAALGIDEENYLRYKLFVSTEDPLAINSPDYVVFSSETADQSEKLEGRWIEDREQPQIKNINYLPIDNFKGKLLIMYVRPIQSFVIRCIQDDPTYTKKEKLNECSFLIVEPGTSVKLNGQNILTYSDIKRKYIHQNAQRIITLSVNNIKYKPTDNNRNIHTLSAREQTGNLVGIVGKEGVGKTTLLKLLAGYLIPDQGNIEINGYDLKKNRYLLKDIIGFVPEEDLLFDELTVFDNLWMTAKLYYSNLTHNVIRKKIDQLLIDLALTDIKDVVVGNVLDKNIQPGQRRILNIALELLREPQLLLVDNALAGLSMTDSAKVIKVLHNYTLEGKLVITSISQVGSNIFGYFDNIWILDEGGYPLYTGRCSKLSEFFSQHLKLTEQHHDTIDPAVIIDLINYHVCDTKTNVSQRAYSPEKWHQLYLTSFEKSEKEPSRKTVFPSRIIRVPNLETQYLIFSIRNFKCKFSRIYNLIYTLLSAPLFAFFIGFFLRHSDKGKYVFAENTNLPAYQYISVIINLFFGIVLSANEILKEKNILKKEQFLDFSRFSYINSKLTYLLLIVLIQTLIYTLIGNALLGIKDMLLPYWLVLFSVASFGVACGLLFSSAAKKLSVIYERILPFFLGLQIIFGGGVISYYNLNLEKTRYVPIVAELMVSRWGYEALAVNQFTENRYQQNFMAVEKNISRANYFTFYLIPELKKILNNYSTIQPVNDSLALYSRILYNEITAISKEPDVFPFEYIDSLNNPAISNSILTETYDYLTYLEMFFYERHEAQIMHKNQIMQQLIDSLGEEKFEKLKEDYFNYKLEKTVTNSDYIDQIELIGDRFVRFRDGIFQTPISNNGRAVMFTPVKIFNGQEMKTIWFNITIIWIFSTLIYLMLITDFVNYIRKLFISS